MISANKSTARKSGIPLRPLTPTRVALRKQVENLEFENKLLNKELRLTKEFALNIE